MENTIIIQCKNLIIRNKWIHIVCIPLIAFSGFGIIQFSSMLSNTENPTLFSINYSTLLLIILSSIYIYINKLVGIITSVCLFLLYSYSQHLYVIAKDNGTSNSLYKFFLITHILAWIAQFVRHGVFEKRAPALTDNGLLASVAPFFVVAEILFMFGWRKSDFEKMDKEIVERIKKFKETTKDKIKK